MTKKTNTITQELLMACKAMALVGTWGKSSPILAQARNAIQRAEKSMQFPTILQSAEDERRQQLNAR